MAAFDTYTQLRQAEDVQDEIYIISPVDNPVCSMSRTIRATGKLHEWTQDVLAAAAKNAQIEGAAAPGDSSTAVLERDNYCQIMTKGAEIAGTLEEVDKYGRDSEMAYQLEKKYAELANDEELAVVGAPGGTRQTKVAGASAATAREMASLHTQLDTSVILYATDTRLVGGVAITTVAELETILLEAHQATYDEGGNPGYLVTGPTESNYIASFAYASGRQRDIRNERKLVNVIDLYVSNFGEMDVLLDRNMDTTNACFLLLDFNYLATPVLRPTRDFPIAKTGDSDEREVLRESTFAVLNDKAHAMVDNIPSGLT